MLECLVNGEILEYVPANNRGFNYGDGLFETIAVNRGHPRGWQDHMDRLAIGCERLGLKMPPQAVLLRETHTVSAGQARCIVKIVLSREISNRAYRPVMNADPLRVVSAHSWPSGIENDATLGIDAHICDLRLSIQPALAGIKHLNRLENVLASYELENLDVAEGILIDAEEHVIGGVSSNIFLVFKGQLITPRLDRSGVRGVLRARILKSFKARCELRRVAPEMLAEASEVFICNSIRGIIPVKRIDAIRYQIGQTSRELQQWWQESQLQK
jgi:4-amino-4-deoxychorismate lyase